jgi:iron(III) transport system ATP-binding protein
MYNAVAEQIGTPREIYNHPATPFVADFIGTMNFYRRNGEIRAIRPEKIGIVERSGSFDVSACVKALEFKGSLTRIYGLLPNLEEICVDVPSDAADAMRLCEDSTIFLSLPSAHLTTYSAAV